jgi:hypothetical protein
MPSGRSLRASRIAYFASSRVESNVGNGEFSGVTISGISVQPRMTHSAHSISDPRWRPGKDPWCFYWSHSFIWTANMSLPCVAIRATIDSQQGTVKLCFTCGQIVAGENR